MLQEEAGTHDGVSSGQKDGKEWIPACAESTPHLEQKGSGGNDGMGAGMTEGAPTW